MRKVHFLGPVNMYPFGSATSNYTVHLARHAETLIHVNLCTPWMKLLANAGKWNESKRLKKTRNPLPRDVSQSTVCPWDVSPSCTWTTSTYWNTWRPSESAARQKRVGVKSRIGTMVRSLACRWCGLGSFLALRVIPKYSGFATSLIAMYFNNKILRTLFTSSIFRTVNLVAPPKPWWEEHIKFS